jgi:hypothetical protein
MFALVKRFVPPKPALLMSMKTECLSLICLVTDLMFSSTVRSVSKNTESVENSVFSCSQVSASP